MLSNINSTRFLNEVSELQKIINDNLKYAQIYDSGEHNKLGWMIQKDAEKAFWNHYNATISRNMLYTKADDINNILISYDLSLSENDMIKTIYMIMEIYLDGYSEEKIAEWKNQSLIGIESLDEHNKINTFWNKIHELLK